MKEGLHPNYVDATVRCACGEVINTKSTKGDFRVELIYASAGINEFLLTGEERMALGANFNFDLAALGGLGLYGFAACTLDDASFVLRMDSFFHCSIPHFIILMFFDIISPVGDIRTYYSTIKEELQGVLQKNFSFFI